MQARLQILVVMAIGDGGPKAFVKTFKRGYCVVGGRMPSALRQLDSGSSIARWRSDTFQIYLVPESRCQCPKS